MPQQVLYLFNRHLRLALWNCIVFLTAMVWDKWSHYHKYSQQTKAIGVACLSYLVDTYNRAHQWNDHEVRNL